MSRFLILVIAVLAAARASAGEIVGYNSQTYDRFTSGFPTAPVANTSASFSGAGLDLSGLGWRDAAPVFGATLITPQHFVVANHTGAFSPGDTVSFFGSGGEVHSYAVASDGNGGVRQRRLTTTFEDQNGTRTLPSDLRVVTLAAPIAAADGVRALAIGQGVAAAGTNLLVAGQNADYGAGKKQLGLNTLAEIVVTSFDNGGVPVTQATTVAVFNFDRNSGRAGETGLIGGDSGNALLTRQGDTAILLGTHYGIDATSRDQGKPYVSASTYLPDYLDQLSAYTAADGQSLTIVPVPEPAGLILVGLAVVGWRRRTRCSQGVGSGFGLVAAGL